MTTKYVATRRSKRSSLGVVFVSLSLAALADWSSHLTPVLSVDAATATKEQSNPKSSKTPNHDNENLAATSSRRVGHLDHWDSVTLASYFGLDWETGKPLPQESQVKSKASPSSGSSLLPATGEETPQAVDQYMGYDAAVLFYAQWCPNCHALAPLYDQIANLIKAGTRQSNVIMALFDCEKDTKHQLLCSSVGVTHYPTLMFVGAGPYRERLSRKEKKMRKNVPPLRRVTKFRGNWQYGEQIMDWINVCHGISSWYQFSRGNPVMKLFRGLFSLPFLGGRSLGGGGGGSGGGGNRVPADTSLPVGVPGTTASSLSGAGGATSSGAGTGGGSTSAASGFELLQVKTKLEDTEKKRKDMEAAATHATMLIDSLLFPAEMSTSGGEENATVAYTDTFAEITARNAWTNYDTNTSNTILRSCMADLSLDYCSRLTTHAVKDEKFLSYFEENTNATLADIETKLLSKLNETEPFCVKVEACILGDFSTEECQPKECPFKNDIGCRYVSACLDPQIQAEYKSLLAAEDTVGATSSTTSTTKATGKASGWGIAS